MAQTTIDEKQLTDFAEDVYEAQKADFVKDLAERMRKSIAIGVAQCERGESMSLDDFKAKFIREHALDGKI